MFYANTSIQINSNWTFLDPGQVFAGQYWDEFGITGHLVPEGGRVLMLGLASGGAIRPILSTHKQIQLTAVDSDAKSVESCGAFFEQHFPQLRFRTEGADALSYLAEQSTTYDAIWADVYLEDGYSPLYFKNEFYRLASELLSPNGVLLLNGYGLPNQFEPLRRRGPQSMIARHLQNNFGFVGALPYRRNLTFIAGRNKPVSSLSEAHPSLNALDKLTFRAFANRLQALVPVEDVEAENSPSLSFKVLDSEMRDLWSTVVDELRLYNVELSRPAEIFDFVQNETLAYQVLNAANERGSMLMTCVPILCAGETNLRELKVDWLFQWFTQHRDRLAASVRDIWTVQLWSMVLQPSRRFRSHESTARDWIEEVFK